MSRGFHGERIVFEGVVLEHMQILRDSINLDPRITASTETEDERNHRHEGKTQHLGENTDEN